jgi:hypothetical protein
MLIQPSAAALAHGGFHEIEQLAAQRIVRVGTQIVPQLHRDVVRAEFRTVKDLSHQPLTAVAVHGSRGRFPAGDDAEPCICPRIRKGPHDKVPAYCPAAVAQQVLELEALTKNGERSPACRLPEIRPCRQTASRARPFARRALMTARPALVFIRTRKPWVRLRRVFEG